MSALRSLRGPRADELRFAATPGRVLAVCGLHGGAGTTTTAAAIAEHAARASRPGRVLLTETDPAAGGLAEHLGHAGTAGLVDLAAAHTLAKPLTGSPFVELPGGARLCAAPAALRAAGDPDAVIAVLEQAAAVHPLSVIDCGTLREPHAQPALARADTVIWQLAGDRLDADRVRRALAGPLTRTARSARWILAAAPGGAPLDLRGLQHAAAELAHAVVVLPDAGRGARGAALAHELAPALRP